MKFEIPGRLPGLNEIIAAAKSHFGQYAKMKEVNTTAIAWMAKALPKYEKVELVITWYEPDRRRDPDNVMAGQKFILDALVLAGVITNDSQRYIAGITHRFDVDPNKPRIEVEIIDVAKRRMGNASDFYGEEKKKELRKARGLKYLRKRCDRNGLEKSCYRRSEAIPPAQG